MIEDHFRLVDACVKIGSGATPRGGSDVYLDQGEVSLIRSQNVLNNCFSRDGRVFLTKQHADELANVEVQPGDVLLNITGDSVARCCQVPDDVLPARVNQHVAIIRPKTAELDPRYLLYFLVSPGMQEYMLGLAAAGATRNALTKGMIEAFRIPKRSITEQRRIADILGSLDDKIELNRRTNETLEAMARTLFRSWFVDFDPVRAKADGQKPQGMDAATAKLFPDSFEPSALGPIPKGWWVARWGEIISLEYGKSLRGYESAIGTVPVYGTNGKIGWHTSPLCPHPGIVVGRKGAYRGVHYSTVPFFVIDTAYYVKPRGEVDLRWAYHEMLALDINSMDSGSAIPSTSRDDFYALPVIVPTVTIQKRFAEVLSPLWQRQISNDEESRTLAAMRDALLPKLLSGEVSVSTDQQHTEGR